MRDPRRGYPRERGLVCRRCALTSQESTVAHSQRMHHQARAAWITPVAAVAACLMANARRGIEVMSPGAVWSGDPTGPGRKVCTDCYEKVFGNKQ